MEMILRAGVGNAILATLLVLVAAGASCLLGRRPALRHALWLLVLLKLITPPLSVVPLAWVDVPAVAGRSEAALPGPGLDTPGSPDAGVEVAPPDAEVVFETEPAESTGVPWWRLAAAVWLAGTFATLFVTAVRVRRWTRLLRLIGPAPAELQARLEALSARLGLVRHPTLWWFPGTAAPMLWALGREARVIVPVGLWEGLDERQRTTLLVHELAHLRRGDHWVRLLEILATACYWWLPPVWIARRALREAEEQCCDAWVVSICPDDARTYAETLLQTVDFLSESAPALPLAASGFGPVHHLKRRLIMIMRGTTSRSLDRPGLLGVLGLAALLLPLSPTWAQKSPDAPPAETPADARPPDKPKPSEDVARDADERLTDYYKELFEARRAHETAKAASPSADAAPKEGDREVGTNPEAKKPETKVFQYQRGRNKLEGLGDLKGGLKGGLKGRLKGEADEALDRAVEQLKKQGVELKAHAEILAPELARAKAEVEAARARLAEAEQRLAALRNAPKSLFRSSRSPAKPKGVDPDDGEARPKGADRAPSTSDRRIADIEARLQQLMDDVKSLKGRGEKPR